MTDEKAKEVITKYIECHDNKCSGFCHNCEYFVDVDEFIEALKKVIKYGK